MGDGIFRRIGRAAAQRIGARLFISANTLVSKVERFGAEPLHDAVPQVDAQRVACFSPYATWDIVSAWELTVLRALARRGCDTRLLLCDAVSPTCDIVWADKSPAWDRCLVCQARATQAARLLRQPFEWLSRYIDPADRARATQWAASLPDDGLQDARFDDAALGQWCVSSVFTHFRLSRLDMEDPRVRLAYRQYLTGAAIALSGCRSWLESFRPDVLWMFNGRMSLTRVAFEAARSLGIRVICHERGMVRHSLRLWENEGCAEYKGLRKNALDNAARPLTSAQVREVIRWIRDRRAARNYNLPPFIKRRPRNAVTSLSAAGVTQREWFVLVLTSSDDEFVAQSDRNRIFPEQHEWLASVLGWAARNPACRVVIRFHPNTSDASWEYITKKLSLGYATGDVASIRRLTANVAVIPPGNPLDTYAFIDACALVATYSTTAGIEAAAVGKSVIVADQCLYHGLPWVQSAESPAHFEKLLDGVPQGVVPLANPDIAAGALRFIWDYHLAPSIKSRLIRHPGMHYARVTYRADDPTKLDYGRDPGLDRITDVILGKRPIYDPRPFINGEAERAAVLAHLKG